MTIHTKPSEAAAVPAPSADPLFKAKGLTKSFGRTVVLDDVGFDVPPNAVVSFVGENGAGKSTLFNILSGIVPADAGAMRLRGAAYCPGSYGAAVADGVSRVFQEQSLIANVPVYENLLLGQEARFTRLGQILDRPAMIAAAERIVEEAGIDVDVRRRTGSYDFSKRQSIEIARACLATTHLGGVERPFVLLDEPTSALDRRDEALFFRLIEKIKRRGSLLFVSHRLTEVLAVSDVIYVLKDGQLVARLDPSTADENTLHGLMVGRERAADYYHEKRQRPVGQAPILIEAEGLSEPGAFENVSFTLRAGEVVGIGGLLDSGKSALGKAVAGVDPPRSGTVALKGGKAARPAIGRFVRRGLGYVPAERLVDGMIAPFSLAWNLSLASGADLFSTRLGLWRRRRETAVAARYVKDLAIRSGTPKVRCARLSGGNQQKVVLARWLCRAPDVLVLDNPTRGVDAGAKEEIYRLIRDLTDRGVGILLITDELLELIGLSHRVFIMQRGRVVTQIAAPAAAKPTERELVAWMLPQSGDPASPAPLSHQAQDHLQ
ncbi:sugar ABC transporter ATP-binding protein [Labrys wisconsinensis]|uniref:Ribose transport system ATP-binding protein n=1 Tax=Labrys wisconsinensis TaxID=425677 RepID=A0ABU0JLZ4_9HYPH|nr:sugar ABC transporter ATP-binding protein [Labrys wisconsinensis]MDQ0475299.1 ribose transport system ATP-binding protein [Labrys wisconsinensis]